MDLDNLVDLIEIKSKSRSLSDEFLQGHGCSTRDEVGIGEYSYRYSNGTRRLGITVSKRITEN